MAKDSSRTREGGYSQGGTNQLSGNPRMTDSSGPKDRTQFNTGKPPKGQGLEGYKSPENQKGSAFSGIQDTSGGGVKELKRSTPGVGMYHSEGQNRGGQATGDYSTSVDSDCEIRHAGLDELRAKQDKAHGKRINEGD